MRIMSLVLLFSVCSSAQAMHSLKRLVVRASIRTFSSSTNDANCIAPWFKMDEAYDITTDKLAAAQIKISNLEKELERAYHHNRELQALKLRSHDQRKQLEEVIEYQANQIIGLHREKQPKHSEQPQIGAKLERDMELSLDLTKRSTK